MNAEQRSQRILEYCNSKGAKYSTEYMAAAIWFGNQGYTDPSFAKIFWGNKWPGIRWRFDGSEPFHYWQRQLQKLVLIEDQLGRLDFLEQHLPNELINSPNKT